MRLTKIFRRNLLELLGITAVLATLLIGCKKGETKREANTEIATKQEAETKEQTTKSEEENKEEENKEEESVSTSQIDFDALGVKPYQYPKEFILEEDLKDAIIQLGISYDMFDQEVVFSQDWKEQFVDRFLKNSRSSNAYLKQMAEKNQGLVTIPEINYMQYSLTNLKIDFAPYIKETVNSYENSSSLNYGTITNYTYKLTEEGVCVTAELEVGSDGMTGTRKRELTVNLIKNEYSCFNGYSICSLTSKALDNIIKPDHKEHIIYGDDMEMEEDGVFCFECTGSEDDLCYAHFVYLDLTELPELAEFVKNNPKSRFKVTYNLDQELTNPIDRIVPSDITLEK
ncbi:MAG: hypothetical protein PUC65_12425 [Clostridiales bacterium]|nr:hypothetical protein [Clostridiales bacterium]